jgi:hypothetical protein
VSSIVPLVTASKKWRFLFRRNFFGLSEDYIRAVYDQMFNFKYYGGWSFIEIYNLPIGLRNWFTERLLKEIKETSEARNKK